ncbi:MAG: hypothetical protein DSZ03_07215 [Sulfurimonas sp.]|nr:MAG: hypothetical protein DSZ03_07215 [Sulfurimonas sp.]
MIFKRLIPALDLKALPRLWTGIIEKSRPLVKGLLAEFLNLSLFGIFKGDSISFYTSNLLTFDF